MGGDDYLHKEIVVMDRTSSESEKDKEIERLTQEIQEANVRFQKTLNDKDYSTLKIREFLKTKKEPNQGLVDSILAQSKRFSGKTNSETVMNYYNDVVSYLKNV